MVRIRTLQGDLLAHEGLDVLVNAANGIGQMGGGIAAAIRRRGGEAILHEYRALCPMAAGQCGYTAAGRLPYKAVAHAVTMKEPASPARAQDVEAAAYEVLCQGWARGYARYGFPLLGTGVGGLAVPDCVRALRAAADRFAAEQSRAEVLMVIGELDGDKYLQLQRLIPDEEVRGGPGRLGPHP